MKLKKLFYIGLFILMSSSFAFSQNVLPNESQKERQVRKMEERKQEYIDNFLYTLKADAFQKEIIKQKLSDFFEKKIALAKLPYKRLLEYEEAVRNLENTHFKDIENMVTEDTMKKIIEMAQGDFDEKEVVKEKRNKKKHN